MTEKKTETPTPPLPDQKMPDGSYLNRDANGRPDFVERPPPEDARQGQAMTIDDRKLTPSPGDEREHARAKALEWIVAGTELNLDNLASLIQRERAEARRGALLDAAGLLDVHYGDMEAATWRDAVRVCMRDIRRLAGKPETGEGG